MTSEVPTDHPSVTDAPAGRPGKIIAVYTSDASPGADRDDRGDRGDRPKQRSYHLRPTSSLASSGGVVERPLGVERLTGEGVVALVIGSPARRVRQIAAWDHVAWVTAANDLRLADLRSNDAGSLLLATGGDGFTPLGPELIDARSLDPGQVRVRTWVNGHLVQNNSASGLPFGLTHIVADLSQHLTLEAGDVILTGTPAGSSVLAPGDVVEVEVDAPGAPKAPSSGRLVTTIVQGDRAFDPALCSLPVAEPAPASPSAGLTVELRERLVRSPVAGLSAQLRKRGLDNVFIEGVRPLVPGQSFVGTARTLRFLPNREDLFAEHGGGYNAQKRTFDSVDAGEVLVIEARGELGSATLGDVLAIRAHARGAAAIVSDGGIRDAEAVAGVGIPVFSSGPHPAVLGRRHVPWDADLTIACGGTTVQPGDVVVGDADGVIVIPPGLVEEVVDGALAQEDEDAWIAEQVKDGHALAGLFPMNAAWRTRYDDWRAQP